MYRLWALIYRISFSDEVGGKKKPTNLILESNSLLLKPCCFEIVDNISDSPVGRVWQLTVLHRAVEKVTQLMSLKAHNVFILFFQMYSNKQYFLLSTEPFALSSIPAARKTNILIINL